ncbi:helix-turn-helix transcriptional regulator [Verminephrobacter eiseniae]|uniref:helix-turn-helix transcriptional regulator n=1 Tax=Verminephrobacter eiseniae TaxID=364317 RepID=UPI0022383440|nr:helix-turn-helix transcriptional regulator [Verminephrobacter eiseniae]MCW5233591.1 helix-turn-helix domain-containing protein [Verminephrobacter eiseniae]MCW5294854.1 helix-turn-helix domain-containing protein [Verminephrobacter eiseniae]MCW8183735.1 helix-turn-helix domain-containing protein [Verminephrobacter eiseniae]MCW8222279.1 helix-turn-helix domain-containing protein [Verminephrobacter eiseniae]MCW8233876.1 helix-turn-helix domain-containing protein [Verminephrobacter eiseniae]
MNERQEAGAGLSTSASPQAAAPTDEAKNPLLVALGERVRKLRAQRGLTRKAVALAAGISERHLANLEYGTGNASILVLQQVAGALHCALAELQGDFTTRSPEWLLIRELLEHRSEPQLRRARLALHALLNGADDPARHSRIALVGLRGAGKSTLGPLLARALDMPFVELSHAIESLAGCSVREIHNLYGTMAYRRHERRALEETLQIHSEVVIATPGGIVSDPATFQQLLAHCTTVWLRAAPEEHMGRVVAQGDMRPMADSQEAMDDLRRILDGRAAFYSKADITIDTSGQTPDQSLQALVSGVRKAMGMGMGMGSSRD